MFQPPTLGGIPIIQLSDLFGRKVREGGQDHRLTAITFLLEVGNQTWSGPKAREASGACAIMHEAASLPNDAENSKCVD